MVIPLKRRGRKGPTPRANPGKNDNYKQQKPKTGGNKRRKGTLHKLSTVQSGSKLDGHPTNQEGGQKPPRPKNTWRRHLPRKKTQKPRPQVVESPRRESEKNSCIKVPFLPRRVLLKSASFTQHMWELLAGNRPAVLPRHARRRQIMGLVFVF